MWAPKGAACLAVVATALVPNPIAAQVYDRTTAIDAGAYVMKDLDVAASGAREALFVYHKQGLTGQVEGGVGLTLTDAGVAGAMLNSGTPRLSSGQGGEDANVAYDRSGDRYLTVWAQGNLYAQWFDQATSMLGPVVVVKEKEKVSLPGEPTLTRVADKPWLSAGFARDRMNDPSQGEFYVSFLFGQMTGDYWFAKTGRGGDDGTWVANPYRDAGGSMLGTGHPFTQGSVARSLEDRPWIVAYHRTRQDKYEFLRFDDPTNRFEELLNDNRSNPSPLSVSAGQINPLSNLIPGHYTPKVVPFLATDPSSDDRFYLVYYEESPAGSSNVDVVCVTFERDPSFPDGAGWRRARTRTMNPGGSARSAEFNPAAVVDDTGRLHVVYYGHDESASTFLPRSYHFYHTYSEDHGDVFSDPFDLSTAMPTLPSGVPMTGPAAIDWSILPATERTFPGEYPALDVVIDGEGVTVWMGWAGNVDGQETAIGSIVETLRPGEPDGAG